MNKSTLRVNRLTWWMITVGLVVFQIWAYFLLLQLGDSLEGAFLGWGAVNTWITASEMMTLFIITSILIVSRTNGMSPTAARILVLAPVVWNYLFRIFLCSSNIALTWERDVLSEILVDIPFVVVMMFALGKKNE
jgi:hypothetical protein